MQIEFWIIKLKAQKDEDRKSNQNVSTALTINISPKYGIDLLFFSPALLPNHTLLDGMWGLRPSVLLSYVGYSEKTEAVIWKDQSVQSFSPAVLLSALLSLCLKHLSLFQICLMHIHLSLHMW